MARPPALTGSLSRMDPIPPRERTLPALLERQAVAFDSKTFLRVGESRRSFTEMRDAVARTAGSFAAAGVTRGDRVAIMRREPPRAPRRLVRLRLARGQPGARPTPRRAGRSSSTRSATRAPAPSRSMTGSSSTSTWSSRCRPSSSGIWLDGGGDGPWRGLPVEQFPEPGDALPPETVTADETVSILYTSGTTGPSRGVMCPQRQFDLVGALGRRRSSAG